ncbi:transposase [Falsiroseomonas sp. HW251]|uniref:transposase n=1 Tax=Falsiroseomonas sp. HW251 TaxID=3390998 RepID=UPI003D319B53
MSDALPAFPLLPTAPRHWWPMSDAQWAELSRILRRAGRGRPPRNARLTWDGIFWVACSRGPWREMPAAFGRPDTAHRTLRRAAKAKLLHRMLLHASRHPGFRDSPLRQIAWYVVRAFRRAFRVAPAAIEFARRLGLESALPAPAWALPRPLLSEAVAFIARKAAPLAGRLPLAFLRALQTLFSHSGGLPRLWRTTG